MASFAPILAEIFAVIFKENVYYESAIPLDFVDILHMVTFYSNNR